MGGIDFTPISQALTLLIQAVADLIKLIDIKVAVIGLTATEIAKRFLPDQVEEKYIPLVGIVVCLLISLLPKFNTDIQTGLITGCFITGGYAVLIKFIEKFAFSIFNKNGNGNGKPGAPAQPAQPEASNSGGQNGQGNN